jgi:hypothetical protein
LSDPRAHAEIEPLLDEYFDGGLDDLRTRAVRGHLRDCERCRARLDGTTRLVEAAGALADLEPPPGLWANLERGLDAEERALAGRGRLFWLWQDLWRKVAFGGGALAVAGAVVWLLALRPVAPHGPALETVKIQASPEALYEDAVHDVARARDDYRAAVDELRALAVGERARWQPEVQRAFDENLAVIDAAVARQSELAGKHPGDVAVADALAETHRRQLDFLQEAVVRGEAAK